MSDFKLRWTDTNMETGEVFHVYESRDHGWKTKEDFLRSVERHRGRVGHHILENGYQYTREEIGTLTKIEAI